MAAFVCTKKNNNKNKMMKELPLEIIESDILPRLPPKSVARFRCVSKQWNSFLSTRKFIMNIINENDYKLLLLDHNKPRFSLRTLDCETGNHGGSKTITRSIPFVVKYILASLDGLVCVASTKTSFYRYLAFWNPMTGDYKMLLPNFPRIYNKYDAIGFYVDSCNDYKLLHVVYGDVKRDVKRAYIYSLRLDSWREIQLLIENVDISMYKWSSATFFGQSLYFTLRKSRGDPNIIVFDVNTEKFRVIQFPPLPNSVPSYAARHMHRGGSLVVLDGCIYLCGACIIMDIDLGVFEQGDMWRMDGDRWEKVEAFPLSHINVILGLDICTTRNGTWLGDLENKNCFTKMNMVDFTTNFVPIYSRTLGCAFRRMIYVETLVSPNM